MNVDRDLRTTAIPMLQWIIVIVLCSLILHALRKFTRQRSTTASYLMSFIDSVAIFFGIALSRITNHRPERCFIIFFSIFGLIFKSILTGNLFVQYQMQSDHRLSTINQLVQLNVTIFGDENIFPNGRPIQLCRGKPVQVHLLIFEEFTESFIIIFGFQHSICQSTEVKSLHEDLFVYPIFAFFTSRRKADEYLIDANESMLRNNISGYDSYILKESYGI